MLLAAVIIAFLILLTALYVAAEFAAVGARRGRLRRLAEDGNTLAKRLLPVPAARTKQWARSRQNAPVSCPTGTPPMTR